MAVHRLDSKVAGRGGASGHLESGGATYLLPAGGGVSRTSGRRNEELMKILFKKSVRAVVVKPGVLRVFKKIRLREKEKRPRPLGRRNSCAHALVSTTSARLCTSHFY
jgi:hypothetical protein